MLLSVLKPGNNWSFLKIINAEDHPLQMKSQADVETIFEAEEY